MWKLNTITKQEEDEYADKVYSLIMSHIDKLKNPSAKKKKKIRIKVRIEKYFDNQAEIKKLLVAKPKELMKIENEFTAVFGAYDKNPEVKAILDYSKLITKNNVAYEIANKKRINTCPYCNRSYTSLIEDRNGQDYILRPDFDHWLDKASHPLLAMSFYNLIPSCQNCNRTIKLNKEFKLTTHYHPYLEKENADFTFTFLPRDVNDYVVAIKNKASLPQNVKNTIKDLGLEAIYAQAHSDYELKDLISLHYSHPSGYIDMLLKTVMKDTGLSRDDVYKYLFGIEPKEEFDLRRPLNKLRRDIIAELSSLRGKKKP